MDISSYIDKIRKNLVEIEQKLSDPDVFSDHQNYENISREHQRLSRLISSYDDLEKSRAELADNVDMLENENDDEFVEEIRADVKRLETKIHRAESRVLTLIMPPGENDSRNTIVEIRPAAGGDEASLFVAVLFRMYTKFAEQRRWKSEVLHSSGTEVGGMKEVAFSLEGEEVYRLMKLESGVHRVQRIPVTETSGRIHTSTVTVAVLPEAKEVDLKINNEDLRIDVFRSQGPGGQSVNTTDSACRITHVPSGLCVASQQEKSQHRNKEIAMRILRSRLLEHKQNEEAAKHAATRKNQVGTGDRSERIRTYNYPQNRVTDHRFNISHHNLPELMEGDLDAFFEEILGVDNARQLEEELAN